MPCTFLLIRHGATSHLNRILSGRAPNVPLNTEGRAQAEVLSRTLAHVSIHHIYASPLQRTQETAEILAKPHNLPILTADALLEANWGDWTLQTFQHLNQDPAWIAFNQNRHAATPPHGESFSDLAQRLLPWLALTAEQHPNHTLALVTHADPIKAALLHAGNLPLSHIQNLTIHPATYSMVVYPITSPPYVVCSNSRQTVPRMLPTYIE